MGASKRAGDGAMAMFDIGISQNQPNLRLPTATLVLNEFFSHNHTLLLSMFRSVLCSEIRKLVLKFKLRETFLSFFRGFVVCREFFRFKLSIFSHCECA